MKNFSLLLLFIGIFACKTQKNQAISVKSASIEQPEENISPNNKEQNSKLLDNQVQKYGIIFTRPENWKTDYEDLKSINRQGKIMSLESVYTDTLNSTRIQFVFHPGKNGKKIYNYKIKNLSKTGKFIKIDGKQAIETSEIIRYNGKGMPIDQPLKRTKISLLINEGELDIIYTGKQQENDKNFDQFIQSIKIAECKK